MLSFEQKLAIADSFPELQRKEVSLGRINYHYEQSAYDKKTVVYHLHPNGNGFVYAGHLEPYETNDKGFVNIRDFTESELRNVIEESIRSLTTSKSEVSSEAGEVREERWTNAKNQVLTLQLEQEDGLWYIYADENLDTVWDTYEEAAEYLAEEGFARD